jgi:hypothetical protein
MASLFAFKAYNIIEEDSELDSVLDPTNTPIIPKDPPRSKNLSTILLSLGSLDP